MPSRRNQFLVHLYITEFDIDIKNKINQIRSLENIWVHESNIHIKMHLSLDISTQN